MSKFAVVLVVYCLITIATVSTQIFDELQLTGNYIDPQFYGNQFVYPPNSGLGGSVTNRIATPIVEEDTEPPAHFPPSLGAVQLNRKATVVPQSNNRLVYPGFTGDFRYNYF